MKKIDRDELFSHVSEFLKVKGVELQEGSYTRTIQKGCQVLADTINLSQQAMERAKAEIDKRVEQARQAIHEKTAPRKPPMQADPAPAEPKPPSKPSKRTARPAAKRKGGKRA